MEDIHQGGVRAQIAAPEAFNEKPAKNDNYQRADAGQADATRMTDSYSRTEFHVDELHGAPRQSNGCKKNQVLQWAQQAVDVLWQGVDKFLFTLSQPIHILLQCAKEADITTELASYNDCADGDKQADNYGYWINDNGVRCHGSKAYRCVRTGFMCGGDGALNDEKQNHQPSHKGNELNDATKFVACHETSLIAPDLYTARMFCTVVGDSLEIGLSSTTKSAS